MNSTTHKITLDLHTTGSQVFIPVLRGDTNRKIAISLTDGGKPFTITNECRAYFSAVKEDGNYIYNDAEISIANNYILYKLTAQTSACAGIVVCQVKLVNSNNEVISTPTFALRVENTVYNGQEILPSSPEFGYLAQQIALIEQELANSVATFKTAAETAKADAETARDNAKASETNAKASENNSLTYRNEAEGFKNEASASATAAETAKADAEISAQSAKASAQEADAILKTKENADNKVFEITSENMTSAEKFPSNRAMAVFVDSQMKKSPRVDEQDSFAQKDLVASIRSTQDGYILVPVKYREILEKREPVVIEKNLDGIESDVGVISVDVDSGMRDWITIYLEIPATTKGTVSVYLDNALAAAQPNGTNTSKTYVNFSLRWNGRRWESYSIVGSGATSGGNIYGRPSYNAANSSPKLININAPDVFPVGTKYVICCGKY